MKRDPRAYLFDIKQAAGEILAYISDMGLNSYSENSLVQAAVERKFLVIGEALMRLRREMPMS